MTAVQKLAATLDSGTAALVTAPHNRRYLTGFPSSAGCVLVTPEKAWFLTDFRYIEAAERRIKHMECVCYDSMTATLRDMLQANGVSTLYIEADSTPLSEKARLDGALGVTVSSDDRLDRALTALRLVKTPDEIARIREAQRVTEEGFDHILGFIRPGMTEREVALELEFDIRRRAGVEAVSFDFIVVAGVNSSMPHGVPGDYVIENGDFVTMDFGALVDGYHSDMTRTVAVGFVTEEMRTVYDTVLRAQEASLSMLAAGVNCRAGDAAARDIIAAAGYGDCFGHGTGHGVGVEIHESPRLSPAAPADMTLAAGHVVTVEPGIYLPGKFGVRIEDMAYITENGCENLTSSPKQLIIL